MEKTLVISIQIDQVDLKEIANIEEKIQKALEDFDNKRVSYNIIEQLLPPPPAR